MRPSAAFPLPGCNFRFLSSPAQGVPACRASPECNLRAWNTLGRFPYPRKLARFLPSPSVLEVNRVAEAAAPPSTDTLPHPTRGREQPARPHHVPRPPLLVKGASRGRRGVLRLPAQVRLPELHLLQVGAARRRQLEFGEPREHPSGPRLQPGLQILQLHQPSACSSGLIFRSRPQTFTFDAMFAACVSIRIRPLAEMKGGRVPFRTLITVFAGTTQRCGMPPSNVAACFVKNCVCGGGPR